VKFDLAVLPGDGVGPDVTSEAIKVLQAIGSKFDHNFDLSYGLIGGLPLMRQGQPSLRIL